ncbi:MAG: XapX domain-containing protein [Akkermansiaceae bacterium]|jgi:XapX domain-containing protein
MSLMAVAFASLGTGLIVGLIFTACKLPLPAPPFFAGVMGIVGIWGGSKLWLLIEQAFNR